MGVTRARSASAFIFLDFLCEALANTDFRHRGFWIEAAHVQDHFVDEPSAKDIQVQCGALTIDMWELEASAISAT
jgi:hypothetical protein